PMPQGFMNILRNNCTVPVTVNTLPTVDHAPISCNSDEFTSSTSLVGKGAEADCNIMLVEGETANLGEAWHEAYQQLRLEDFEAAEEGFQPIADLWQEDLSNYPPNCQLYIQVAKAIVDGTSEGGLPRPN